MLGSHGMRNALRLRTRFIVVAYIAALVDSRRTRGRDPRLIQGGNWARRGRQTSNATRHPRAKRRETPDAPSVNSARMGLTSSPRQTWATLRRTALPVLGSQELVVGPVPHNVSTVYTSVHVAAALSHSLHKPCTTAVPSPPAHTERFSQSEFHSGAHGSDAQERLLFFEATNESRSQRVLHAVCVLRPFHSQVKERRVQRNHATLTRCSVTLCVLVHDKGSYVKRNHATPSVKQACRRHGAQPLCAGLCALRASFPRPCRTGGD